VTGSAASVQTILTAASTSLVTLTSVVLSLTLVAVQLAMGQFSPRVVRAILHDRRSQLAVGLFIGTFAYSMTVLREVNGKSSGGGSLPGLAVVVDYGLILSAIVVLVLYVHHTAQSIRVGGLIGWVADATCEEVDRLYPAAPESEEDPSVVAAPDYGIVTKLPHQHPTAASCERRHAAALDFDEFLRRVDERERTDVASAKRHVRVVFGSRCARRHAGRGRPPCPSASVSRRITPIGRGDHAPPPGHTRGAAGRCASERSREPPNQRAERRDQLSRDGAWSDEERDADGLQQGQKDADDDDLDRLERIACRNVEKHRAWSFGRCAARSTGRFTWIAGTHLARSCM
jgi:Predicted membrane protein (DUF2254)